MFDNLVTRCTIANQIRQSICFHIFFDSEYSKRNFMMNVKLFAKFFFSDRAILAFIAVSVSCVAALLMPVSAIVRFVSTLPVAVVFTCPYTRLAHPVIGTFLRTECSFFNFGWTPVKFFIAKQTDSFKLIVLWMIRTVFSVFFLINSKTGHCAECFSKSFYSGWSAHHKSATYFARNFYKLSTRCIPTLKRTIFLLRVATRWLKFDLTLKAGFWEYRSAGFIRAINGTKTNNSVCSLFNLRLTIFTRFHKINIAII